ncbi:hypothetical protein GWI33_012892, partial [Rhynchophorus ferrugineus]
VLNLILSNQIIYLL